MANNDGKLVVIMIMALVAFGIGAVAGISIGIDGINGTEDNSTNGTHIENVTEQMTTNLNDNVEPIYNAEIDDVDYNDASTIDENTSN